MFLINDKHASIGWLLLRITLYPPLLLCFAIALTAIGLSTSTVPPDALTVWIIIMFSAAIAWGFWSGIQDDNLSLACFSPCVFVLCLAAFMLSPYADSALSILWRVVLGSFVLILLIGPLYYVANSLLLRVLLVLCYVVLLALRFPDVPPLHHGLHVFGFASIVVALLFSIKKCSLTYRLREAITDLYEAEDLVFRINLFILVVTSVGVAAIITGATLTSVFTDEYEAHVRDVWGVTLALIGGAVVLFRVLFGLAVCIVTERSLPAGDFSRVVPATSVLDKEKRPGMGLNAQGTAGMGIYAQGTAASGIGYGPDNKP